MTILTKKVQEKRISRKCAAAAKRFPEFFKGLWAGSESSGGHIHEWSPRSTISVTSRQDAILPAKQSACLKLGHCTAPQRLWRVTGIQESQIAVGDRGSGAGELAFCCLLRFKYRENPPAPIRAVFSHGAGKGEFLALVRQKMPRCQKCLKLPYNTLLYGAWWC